MNNNRMEGMLAPYRALDLTDEKGFLCGKALADLGCDVVKIEKPGGDKSRRIGPFYRDIYHPEKSLYRLAFNANKRGITLDIETADGQGIFKKLVQKADFVIESFPPGDMDKLGLGYSDLSRLNEQIIFTSITPFGNRCSYAAPHGVYRCRGEDRWCAIAVFTDEEWESFCRVMGNPLWTKEPQFSTMLGRVKNSVDLVQRVERWTLNYSPEEVTLLLQHAGVSAGVVQNGEDLWEDPQLKHRNSICQLEHPEIGTAVCQRVGVSLPEIAYELRRAPILGEHTEDICKRVLRMTDDEFIQLFNEGVFE